jgi:hypothetical protein
LGQADAGNQAYGIWGKAAQGHAVHAQSISGYGVYATTGGGGTAAGVYGTSSGANGNGVIGEANNGAAVGVLGKSTGGTGVRGSTTSGRALEGVTFGGGAGVFGSNFTGSNTTGFAGDFFGRVRVTGDLVLSNTSSNSAVIRVPGAGVGTGTAAFIHQSSSGNIVGNKTYIVNPLTNGDPNAILFVTPRGGNNDHPVGVLYDAGVGQWAIYNTDGGDMTCSGFCTLPAFNVLVVKTS